MSSGETGVAPGDKDKENIAGDGKKTLRIKIISMGAPESGKSCLIKRFCEKRFVSKYMATLGIDYGVTSTTIQGHPVKVNIFDMAGQPFFYEVRNEFYKGTHGALLVYDVTNRTSFENLTDWLSEMKDHTHKSTDMSKVVIVVCANKVDLGKRKVDESEGRLWAETRGFLYHETSAQSGENVSEMFESLFGAVVKLITTGQRPMADASYTAEQAALVQKIRSCHDNHEMMGLSRHSTREEILRMYRQLAVQLHPDKNRAPGSEEAFKALTQAKDYLLTFK